MDAWFAETSVANVADLLNRFFLSLGFRFTEGTAASANYSNGKRLSKQQAYSVAVSEHMGSIHSTVSVTMASRAKRKLLAVQLATFLKDPANLRQAEPLREVAGTAPSLAASPKAAGGSPAKATAGNALGILVVLALVTGGSFFATSASGRSRASSFINRIANNHSASPNCVKTDLASQDGMDWHKLTDSTSTAPCWAHWNVSLAPGCEFRLNGSGPYSAPANVWNIEDWATGPNATVAHLQDNQVLSWSCVVDVRRTPQTTPHVPDFS